MQTAIRFSTFVLLFFWAGYTHAQLITQAQRGDYIFGINAGFAYQSSDVRAAGNGSGFGLTLGRTMVAGPNSPILLDLRGRLLYARTYGLDPFRSFAIENNKALNGTRLLDYTAYPAALEEPRGFVYQNHRTTHGELGLEAVFTLEELRRKTGFIVSLFGGAGLNGYHVKTDQADASGEAYYAGYANLNDSRPANAILRDLRDVILDGAYESNADNFDGLPKFRIMPNVGVELGLQLGRAFSVHAGHRVTFSGTDLLDGHQWSSPDKDIYHYTSFGMAWRFRVPERVRIQPPVIEIVAPLSRPHYTRDPNGVVRAQIRNVRSAADINCTVNGRDVPFRFSGEQFVLDLPLYPGSNEVIIVARNQAGTARGDAVIVLEGGIVPPPPPIGRAPRISITNPPSRTATVYEPAFTLRATVTDILNKLDIELLVDGARRDFTFDSRTGNLRADLNLREGTNRIRITARNDFGSDAADAEVVFEQRRFPPTVRITDPASERSEVSVNSVAVRAELRYVEAKENVYLYINGQESRSFDYDASRELFQATVPLREGANTVEIVARNRSGEARDAATVTYRRPLQALPTVVITEPSGSGTSTTAATAAIEATTGNIQRRDDISFFVNGARNTNFTFNANTGRFSATANLVIGNNDFIIRVVNSDGSAEAVTSIRRTEGSGELPLRPVVRILSPANQSESDRNTASVRASIENVTDRNNMSLTVNGTRLTNFSFNTGNRELTATVTLIEGNNTIRVEATNRDGTADDLVNVRYRRPLPPVVTISAPQDKSTVTAAAATLRARAQNVSERNQITVTLNGTTISNVSFNAATGELSADVTLAEGSNTLRVRAATPDGTDEKSVNVQYTRPTPPIVSIVAPENNSTLTVAAATLRARAQHVSERNQITVTLNGATVSNVTFNGATGELSANVTLIEGNNTLRVRAATPAGSDEQSVNVRYRRPIPPVVSISAPANNSTLTAAATTLRARAQNVSNQNQLTVTLNGAALSNVNFNPTTGDLSADVTLAEGANTLRVSAATPDGTDEKSVSVRYRRPVPPVVSIQSPSDNSTTESNSVKISATVTNVTSTRAVTFTVNGKASGDFKLEGGNFSAEVLNLREGENTFSIAARNEDGAGNASVTVVYRPKPVQLKPVVKFIVPARSGTASSTAETAIKASVLNVSSADDVRLDVNGKPFGEFTYNTKLKELTATVPLEGGTNTFRVIAENEAGRDTATTTVLYREAAKQPPVVTIESVSQPTINPMNPGQGRSTIIAQIQGIERASQIAFTVNGTPVTDFTYNAKTGAFQSTVTLVRGTNTIVLRAENADGADEKSRKLDF
jgi:large repetitive protein